MIRERDAVHASRITFTYHASRKRGFRNEKYTDNPAASLERVAHHPPATLDRLLGAALDRNHAGGSDPDSVGQPSGELLFQQSQPACQTCHPEEYADWQNTVHAKAALDPVFKEQFAKSHNQGDCLKCHTTGFDKSSGKFAWEGVTCEACHGPYKQGHPAAQTMQLPMESTTCRVCHEAAFGEWEKSSHAQQKIECFDCHRSHTQGLRTGSAETLCAACHNNQQTQLKHSIHGIGGVDCGNCHMAKAQKNTAGGASTTGAEIEAKSHSFSVPTDVCNRCHSNTIHPIGSQSTVSRPVAEMRSVGQAGPGDDRMQDRSAELEKQVSNSAETPDGAAR